MALAAKSFHLDALRLNFRLFDSADASQCIFVYICAFLTLYFNLKAENETLYRHSYFFYLKQKR